MNNRHFSNLLDFALEIAEPFAYTANELVELKRIETMRDNGAFWPGRGLTLDEDFHDIEALKYWCKAFFETGQSVFLRSVGCQENTAWQAQMIFFAEATGRLFLKAVHDVERGWYPDIRANLELITSEHHQNG